MGSAAAVGVMALRALSPLPIWSGKNPRRPPERPLRVIVVVGHLLHRALL